MSGSLVVISTPCLKSGSRVAVLPVHSTVISPVSPGMNDSPLTALIVHLQVVRLHFQFQWRIPHVLDQKRMALL